MTAAESLNRIVQLVAELNRLESRGEPGRTYGELAATFRVSEGQIAEDLRTLTLLGDHSDAEWLLALHVMQQEDRVSVWSGGPFRRPIKFTPDELLALRMALAMEPEGRDLARKLSASLPAGPPARPPADLSPAGPPARPPVVLDLLSAAVAEHRSVYLLYAGEGETEGREWVIHPHQLVGYRGRTYVVAWCANTSDWRHFRLDRVLDASLGAGSFTPRDDFRPVLARDDLFRAPDDAVEQVTVRFSPAAAPRAGDRYAGSVALPDGSTEVTFRAASVDWLVRRVLEYGPDAEVIAPASYREAMRRAVA